MNDFREATLEDVYDIIPLVRQFYKEGTYKDVGMGWDNDHVRQHTENQINNPGSLSLVLENEDGELVGFFCAFVTTHMFAPEPFAAELAWFVRKDYRGPRVAMQAIKRYIEWGEANNCKLMNMACIVGLKENQLEKIYNRFGFYRKETTFIKRLK